MFIKNSKQTHTHVMRHYENYNEKVKHKNELSNAPTLHVQHVFRKGATLENRIGMTGRKIVVRTGKIKKNTHTT